MSYFGYSFRPKKTVGRKKFHLTITFSKIRLYTAKHDVITSGAKNVRGKMQRVLLTNQLTNNLTVAKTISVSITSLLF